MFFTAFALLLELTVLCSGIFIGILPETLYLLLASYHYSREEFGLGNIFETLLAALAVSELSLETEDSPAGRVDLF